MAAQAPVPLHDLVSLPSPPFPGRTRIGVSWPLVRMLSFSVAKAGSLIVSPRASRFANFVV